MILVEGITDVWRIGDGCCALTGKVMTTEQQLLILRKKIKSILVLLDSDAEREAWKISTQLSGIVPYVDFAVNKIEDLVYTSNVTNFCEVRVFFHNSSFIY